MIDDLETQRQTELMHSLESGKRDASGDEAELSAQMEREASASPLRLAEHANDGGMGIAVGPKVKPPPPLPEGFDPQTLIGKPFLHKSGGLLPGCVYVPVELQKDKRRRPEYRVRRWAGNYEDDITILVVDFLAQMNEVKGNSKANEVAAEAVRGVEDEKAEQPKPVGRPKKP